MDNFVGGFHGPGLNVAGISSAHSYFISQNSIVWHHLATRELRMQSKCVVRRKKEVEFLKHITLCQWLSFLSPGAHFTVPPTQSTFLSPSQGSQLIVPPGPCIQAQSPASSTNDVILKPSSLPDVTAQNLMTCSLRQTPVPSSYQIFI